MHITSMSDLDGEFGAWRRSNFKCRFCQSTNHFYRLWESSCGGYVDEEHKCNSCKKNWWVEGPDS